MVEETTTRPPAAAAGPESGLAETLAKEHRTVSRVMTILETVAGDPHGVRLSVLCGVLDAPKSSVFSLVKGLVASGYLTESEGVYQLGPAVGALLAMPRPSLIDVARPGMQDLRARFDETVMLATAVGNSLVYLVSVESTQAIRYSAPLRRRRPLYPPSTGKCLLAFMPPRRRASYLRELIGDPEALPAIEAELESVRASGLAFNRGETVPDVSAAAAIVRVGGRPTASLAVAGPSVRLGPRLDEVGDAVRDAAQTISGLG